MDTATTIAGRSIPWNKGKLLGQKPPLRLKDLGHPIRLQLDHRARELVLFNLATTAVAGALWTRVHDAVQRSHVPPARRQKKTQRPVQFEITEQTREAVAAWVKEAHRQPEHFLFPSRVSGSPHLSTPAVFSPVGQWVESIGLDPAASGTRVQLLLGHTKLESTVRYLGIEVDDALEIAEQTEV
jgi:integrase